MKKDLISLFQYNTCFGSTEYESLGYKIIYKFQYNTCFGSTFYGANKCFMNILFQYNTCFGSTKAVLSWNISNTNFNTTLVSVRLKQYLVGIYQIQISIQHLFRFDRFELIKTVPYFLFQYNTCFGSTQVILSTFHINLDFNTTLVSVRLCKMTLTHSS